MRGRIVMLTHKGWFGLCPVWIGLLHTEEPIVEPRHALLGWLMDLSDGIYAALHTLQAMVSDEEPSFPLRITGEIEPICRVIRD